MRGSVTRALRRCELFVGLAVWLAGLNCLPGCAHVVETRTIELFSKALEKGDLEQLKEATSSNFESLALRQDAAVEDLKVLRLPTGDIEIADVEEVSPAVKRVAVLVGESKTRLKYQLKLDPRTKRWVVDDVYLKQKGEGVEATKSVTEQMDLLLSVREFLDAWKSGTREQVLASATPEFADALQPLPPQYLNRLTQQVVGKHKIGRRLQPRANLDESFAYVRLPVGVGEMLLTMKRGEGHWLVDEIAIASRDDKEAVNSARQLALITRAATGFLDAYHAADKEQLRSFCTPKFFTASLAAANLSQVPLPHGEKSIDNVKVQVAMPTSNGTDAEAARQVRGKHADFIVEGQHEVLKLSVVRQDSADANVPQSFLVEDVTLYELDSRQEKRLSALFTSHAIVQLFAEALASRDLESLRLSSSPDFRNRVWLRTQVGTLHQMPLSEIEDAPPKVQSTVFAGPITEVTVTQGSRALTYRLQDRQGVVTVDDVLLPTLGRPNSLKATLEHMLPILDFATGVRLGQLALLQRNSSRDFNRLVWQQTPKLPEFNFDMLSHLHAPLVSLETSDDRATVVLGGDKLGAHVTLVRESGQHVIDELWLISGPMPRDRVELKRSLRIQLATSGATKTSRDGTAASP